ncbi:MAG: hypothetical protein HZB67_00895 [Candidatus Aenigmarchaeota archaeon]|nr:hypothetical protein [Candidatus Aenigmarchaeota archaeon]
MTYDIIELHVKLKLEKGTTETFYQTNHEGADPTGLYMKREEAKEKMRDGDRLYKITVKRMK